MLAEDAPDLAELSDEDFRAHLGGLMRLAEQDRKENALRDFKPVSQNARRIWESDARVFAFGGGNGCLPLHALVLMADGSWKPLSDVVRGDMVIAADPKTGRAAPAPVVRTWRSGRKPVYRVTFSDGGSFEATAEHMVPLYLGSGRKTTKGNVKVAHKRRLGEYIEPIMRRGAKNPSKRISAVSPADIQFDSQDAVPLPPYLLGALLGDGSLGRSIKFTNADQDVIERVRRHAEEMGCSLTKYQGYDYGIVGCGLKGSNAVMNAVRSLGLAGCTSYTKFIPRAAFAWSRENRLELLAGLVDTDGTTDWYSTCSAQLATDVAMLVRSLGGKATINKHISKCQNGVSVESYGVYIRLNERLPLAISRKQATNQRGREIDYTRRVCRSAELVGAFECGDLEVDHPAHCYVTGDFVVVSNSSKTESVLTFIAACATGIFPESMKHTARKWFRGPINVRVVCESLTTVLYPVMLPKLQWWKWTGVDEPGGERGHWGWIPPYCLKDRQWDKAWTEKLRTLTVICRDPDDPNIVRGESTIQFTSFDQDPSDFASGDFHLVMHDEPPPLAIWRENEARTMRVAGRMLLSMTWPDDPAIPVDWIFDEVYEPGITEHGGQVEWVNLYTTDNPHLNQDAVAMQAAKWSEEMRSVRIYGKPIRFSNRIHPLFTDQTQHWCFSCGKVTIAQDNPTRAGLADLWTCTLCGGNAVTEFNHVEEFEPAAYWPTVWVVDPHPRKPHMGLWVQIDPSDDWWVVDEFAVEGDPVDVRRHCDGVEERYGLNIPLRLIDPNMGRSPSSSKRGRVWQDDFDEAGLVTELADDSETGRKTINTLLKPDDATMRPRIRIHPRCRSTISQLKRYSWDDYKRASEKDQKQVPKSKNDDFPTCLKYVANHAPTFAGLRGIGAILHRGGVRRGAY